MEWLHVLTALISGSVGGAVAGASIERKKILWADKRDACMKALDVVNRHFSHVGDW